MNFLLSRGYNIELIRRSVIPGEHRADMKVNGIIREMKAPIGNSEWTLKQILRRSKKQSKRVIVDLRRCKRDDNKANRELLKYFKETKSLEELWIITKQNKLKKYKK